MQIKKKKKKKKKKKHIVDSAFLDIVALCVISRCSLSLSLFSHFLVVTMLYILSIFLTLINYVIWLVGLSLTYLLSRPSFH